MLLQQNGKLLLMMVQKLLVLILGQYNRVVESMTVELPPHLVQRIDLSLHRGSYMSHVLLNLLN